ncbi:Indigoidine synthase A like protein-domain-containing protein [Chytridium lagenaria]|nr:Indigoidine synthase A like protein-domain-containing protein [Chytridium lagenaria]
MLRAQTCKWLHGVRLLHTASLSSIPKSFIVHPEVADALRSRKPVVALESTIITHGMPFPTNLETAQQVEQTIRDQGSIPATIALLDGHVHVGLSFPQLERLSHTSNATKTSRRDLALVLSQKLTGSTTVAATMAVAHACGVQVFVTGGVGGVHRGGEVSMDVSADLMELGRTNVAVVCAGVKSILDVGRTLEVLETEGVPVVSYGTEDFPAFYVQRVGLSIARMDTPKDCAKLIQANRDLGLQNGVLIAVPIPEKDVAIDGDALEEAILKALYEADVLGIKGKDITPFLLDKVKSLTAGGSLASNIALIKNNALIGSQIAKELSHLDNPVSFFSSTPSPAPVKVDDPYRTLVIGGTVMDITAMTDHAEPQLGTSYPGNVKTSLGGVGRNVAEACFRSGGNPLLVSAVGGDAFGKAALREMKEMGMVRIAGRVFFFCFFISVILF